MATMRSLHKVSRLLYIAAALLGVLVSLVLLLRQPPPARTSILAVQRRHMEWTAHSRFSADPLLSINASGTATPDLDEWDELMQAESEEDRARVATSTWTTIGSACKFIPDMSSSKEFAIHAPSLVCMHVQSGLLENKLLWTTASRCLQIGLS
jgi:hypothetical protein